MAASGARRIRPHVPQFSRRLAEFLFDRYQAFVHASARREKVEDDL